MRNALLYFVLLIIANPISLFSQERIEKNIEIHWANMRSHDSSQVTLRQLKFQTSIASAVYDGLKCYAFSIPLNEYQEIKVQTSDVTTKPFNGTSSKNSIQYNLRPSFPITVDYLYDRGQKSAQIKVEVFKLSLNQQINLLNSVRLIIDIIDSKQIGTSKGRTYANHSVLAQGDWYKIKLSKSGIYKVTGTELQGMGFSISNLDINHIRLYGNGGGMLPELNSVERYDDLFENAIEIKDLNNNGLFDANDYFLFYGTAPNTWTYNNQINAFTHKKHIYDDYAYYFVNVQIGQGKRIETDTNSYGTSNVFVNKFTDFAFHENDSLNLIKTGREWYGEQFDVITSYKFNFSFPNLVTESPILVRTDAIARSTYNSNMLLRVNGNEKILQFSAVNPHYLATYANEVLDTFYLKSSTYNISAQLVYTKPNSSAQAWLNFLEINAQRHLTMYGQQMTFRTPETVGAGNIAEYTLENANQNYEVWNISNPQEALKMVTTINNTTLKFTNSAENLKTFVAHIGEYYTAANVGAVSNQDLHSLSNIDYVILYHPSFKNQAIQLADFHRSNSNLTVYTTDAQTIYNEFSSGAKDVSGIRDFMKMLYDKAAGDVSKMPKYLLFFGDASYDFKDRIANNTNMLLTYESSNSLSPTISYSTDDFFGLLDDNEGTNSDGSIDIGLGRFPITTTSQANDILSKIFRYKSPNPKDQNSGNSCSNGSNNIEALADWRNVCCFIGDDEDGNLHTSQADYLANYVGVNYPDYNIDKIFLDAYTQVTTPGGQRYPEVNTAINQRVERGALVINYTGHGGEEGLSHESIVEVKDINGWSNYNSLPLFITATCEFSRYDDPGRISAGEYVLLNPNGGGIALLTTSRVTYSSTNFILSKVVYQNLFEKQNGEYPSLGDVLRISKIGAGSVSANKNFILLGDPALKIAYPYDEVFTSAIVDDETGLAIDTIKALQRIRISGEIQHGGQLVNTFNGIIYPTIFDKSRTYSTLGNDVESPVYQFQLQKNILYKGKSKVENGKFEFTFVVPKDIAYNYGFGKISYYATNDTTDANGYHDTINIGGSYVLANEDNKGPEIELFINDTFFVNGGITDENPKLLAFVFDEHGINTIGNGIGHDLTAVLDENSSQPIVLNDYYEAELDNFQKGIIRYPFFSLAEGNHVLTLKVWDVYNNSSEAKIDFLVSSSQEMALDNLLNAPNPFYDVTSIVFEHNQSCDILDVQVFIYNTSGQLVRKLTAQVNSSGYRVGPGQLVWDGRGEGGDNLAQGIYVYQLHIANCDGTYQEKTSKMVLMK